MKISDIAAAKQLKIRFEVPDARSKFPKAADTYLSVERTDSPYEFIIQTFEQRSGSNHESVIGRVDASTADYLHDLLMGPDQGGLHSFFELENVEARWVEVQAYGFESLTDYQTDVILQIPRELAEHYTEQRLREMFVGQFKAVVPFKCVRQQPLKRPHRVRCHCNGQSHGKRNT